MVQVSGNMYWALPYDKSHPGNGHPAASRQMLSRHQMLYLNKYPFVLQYILRTFFLIRVYREPFQPKAVLHPKRFQTDRCFLFNPKCRKQVFEVL